MTPKKTMRYIRKPKLSNGNFTILYDKQEKKPWVLPPQYPMGRVHLKCGDYTIKGYEDLIAIEKKSGIAELFTDLAVGYRPTFKRFLRRLSKYPIRCIVVEDELSRVDAVYYRIKKVAPEMQMTPHTIFYWVEEIILVYCIPVLFLPRNIVIREMEQIFRTAYRRAQELRQ